MVRKRLEKYHVSGNDMLVLKEKLKHLKGDLKVWNKKFFGDIMKKNHCSH